MPLRLRLANRLILCDTQHPIDPEQRRREVIPCGDDQMEAWVFQYGKSPDIVCLKFPGTGGRAEQAGPHPCEIISSEFEVWTINPPGYGSSTGQACVSKMVATSEAAWLAVEKRAAGRPIVVTGNSLGCMYALYVASRYPVAGMLLRNPAPVHQLIKGEYSWWNAGLAARFIASQVPQAMDAVANARLCKAPALFVMSGADRRVPVQYQKMVIDQYQGPHATFLVPGADHDHPIPEALVDDYVQSVKAWKSRLPAHN